MKPVHFPGQTAVLGAPPDWEAEKRGPCVGLPIYSDGDGFMASYWRPTRRERLLLLLGRHIQLSVIGSGHPPVMLEAKPLPRERMTWRWFNIAVPDQFWMFWWRGRQWTVRLFEAFNRHTNDGDHYWGVGVLQIGSRHLFWLGDQGRDARVKGVRLLLFWIGRTG